MKNDFDALQTALHRQDALTGCLTSVSTLHGHGVICHVLYGRCIVAIPADLLLPGDFSDVKRQTMAVSMIGESVAFLVKAVDPASGIAVGSALIDGVTA